MLRIDVAATPHELSLIPDKTHYAAVVIDALRATSTITTALSNGCSAMFPVTTIEEAQALKVRRPHAYLAGERKGARLPSFDFGNSPAEYRPETIAGREVIFTTSNGTPVLVACSSASITLAGCFLNRAAVARFLNESGRDILIACAGHHGKLAVEDLTCAGAIAEALLNYAPYELTDATKAALALFERYKTDLTSLLAQSYSGRNIASLGYWADIPYCASMDLLSSVPIFSNGEIRL